MTRMEGEEQREEKTEEKEHNENNGFVDAEFDE